MQYLIIQKGEEPYLTEWFIPENNLVEGMTVFDMYNIKYIEYGVEWKEIEIDNL